MEQEKLYNGVMARLEIRISQPSSGQPTPVYRLQFGPAEKPRAQFDVPVEGGANFAAELAAIAAIIKNR